MRNPNSLFLFFAFLIFQLATVPVALSVDELPAIWEAGGKLAKMQDYPPPAHLSQGLVGISVIFIDPVVDKSRADVRIEFRNDTGSPQNVKYDCVLSSSVAKLSNKGGSLTLEPGVVSQTKLNFDIENAHLWSPEDPYLYTMTVKLLDSSGSDLDSRKTNFGMRSIEIGKDMRLYLNGRPTYLRGNTWFPRNCFLMPFEPSFCRKMMIEQKKQGFNYIRHHSTVPPYWYYDIADELGMLIEVETGWFDLEASKAYVRNLYNHPSIVIWGGVNEMQKTGIKPEVQAWYKMMKSLDSTRPVVDCSGWGEYDRDTTDILNQHMGYEYPYLTNEDMYIARYGVYEYNGSAKGVPWSETAAAIKAGTFKPGKPEMIHELQGNAQVYNMKTLILDSRMRAIWEVFGLDYADWPNYVKVCQRFVNATYKLQIEAARRGDNKIGFDFLVVADSIPESIRNDNEKSKPSTRWPELGDMDITGTCDYLGDSKPYLVEDFPKFNAANVVLLDTHSKPRTMWTDEAIKATVMSSCFDYAPPKKVELVWKLKNNKQVVAHGEIDNVELKYPGVGKVGDLDIAMPQLTIPALLILEVEIKGKDYRVANDWKFWAFPKLKAENPAAGKRVYTNIKWVKDLGYATDYVNNQIAPITADLLISDEIGPDELNYLDNGGKLLVLQDHTKPGLSCTPSPYRHRMYHEWLGCAMGVVVHDHPALGLFPHEGFNDLQFYQLAMAVVKTEQRVNPYNASDGFKDPQLYHLAKGVGTGYDDRLLTQGGQRFMLDDLPGRIIPILESVPCLEQNQSRNTGELVEMRLGNGKALACGLNLSLAIGGECTSTWLLKEFVNYCLSDKFSPVYQCSRADFERYTKKAAERVWVHDSGKSSYFCTLPAGGLVNTWTCTDIALDEFGVHLSRMATDGYPSTYWEPIKLPADIGITWNQPVKIAEIGLDFVDNLSVPSDDGWEFQIQENGQWKKADVNCEKIDEMHWKLLINGGISTQQCRVYFTKMNAVNTESIVRGAYAGGARVGYPFPMTRLMEKAVPRVREMKVTPTGD
jgi:hypothetical protein